MLHCDFETYCDINVKNVGPQRYARDKSCEVLMLSYAFDDGPVKLWVPDGRWDYDSIPRRITRHITHGGKIVAHNIEFEANIFRHVLGIEIPWCQFYDTAVMSLKRGFPASLDGASKAVGLPVSKDNRGKLLIRKFCQPRKPSKNNPSTRWYPGIVPEDWEDFKEYCVQDTVVERELWHKFGGRWPLHGIEQWTYEETLRMNERGLPVDNHLACKAIQFIEGYNADQVEECKNITFGIAPTQRDKLLEWLQNEGLQINTLQRVELEHILEEEDLDPELEAVVRIRLDQGRVSTKKLYQMLQLDIGDGLVRGSFMFHGASTGRFVARRLQPHNFQRPTIKDTYCVLVLLENNPDQIRIEFAGNVLEAVGSAMRHFFMALDGRELVVADYNAIEARVLAWLARQRDLVALFHKGKDVYCVMAAYIFGGSAEELERLYKEGDQEAEQKRKLGKDTVLGCGYGMGVSKFLWQLENKGNDTIAGVVIRLHPSMRGKHGRPTFNPKAWKLASKAVYGYRDKYSNIVALWGVVEEAIFRTLKTNRRTKINNGMIRFRMEEDALVMTLPSGRDIYYPQAEIVDGFNQYSGEPEEQIRYRAVNRKNMWVWVSLYGSMSVEHISQATAFDLMAHGMKQASKPSYDYRVLGTIHDEIITDHRAPYDEDDLKFIVAEFIRLICILPGWAKGKDLASTIPLRAEGYMERRYRK